MAELDAASPETDASIRADFEKMLDLALGTDALERLSSQRYSKEIEELVKTLVGAEIGRFTIAERSLLPSEERPISVIRILQDSRDEITLDGFSKIVTPAESRRAIKMAAFDVAPPDMSAEARMAAVAVAQAAVRTNFSYNQLLTEDRRRAARSDVLDVVIQVQRGTTIVREGEVVSEAQFETLSAMAEARGATARGRSLCRSELLRSARLLCALHLRRGLHQEVLPRPRDIEAAAFLMLVVLGLGRLVMEMSEPMAAVVGTGACRLRVCGTSLLWRAERCWFASS